MNFVAHICGKITQDSLNPTHFCKACDGEGSAPSSCPIEGEINPELCQFVVKSVPRIIPWLHGNIEEKEVAKVETKTNKRQKTTTAKRRTAHKD